MSVDDVFKNELFSRGWCMLPKRIIEDAGLTDKEKVTFAFVTSYMAQTGYCWASNDHLAGKLQCSKKHVSEVLHKLERKGYFRILVLRDPTSGHVTERRVYLADPAVYTKEGGLRTEPERVSGSDGIPLRLEPESNNTKLEQKEREAGLPSSLSGPEKQDSYHQVCKIFAKTDPDLASERHKYGALVRTILDVKTIQEVALAAGELRFDPKRVEKGELGFVWLFDAIWEGKYAAERIERYTRLAEKRRSVQRIVAAKRQKLSSKINYTPTKEEHERIGKIIRETIEKLK
jgi:hypothetical protein